ncbi:MAG: MFS transporter [Anaerolineae bacterium]|nr:MFS transporter [Anaerolineae bacterium]
MIKDPLLSPWHVLVPVGLGTALSLIGDTSLYAVLPTHVADAGVSLASVGILLSANRFIRLILNGPMGWVYDRFPRRYLFITALFIGALSTALYALVDGFWPLLTARLLWGLAWYLLSTVMIALILLLAWQWGFRSKPAVQAYYRTTHGSDQ